MYTKVAVGFVWAVGLLVLLVLLGSRSEETFIEIWMWTAGHRSEHRELVLGKLGEKGLMGFTAHQVWNQDENLTRMYIFEYESPEAVKACLPVWKELETAIFGGIAMKLTAYRGVTVEAWKRD